jgi:outer membrane protein assembly factor BamB
MSIRALLCCCACLALGACDTTHADAPPETRVPPTRAAATGHDWPTFNADVNRSGVSPYPTGITTANVSSLRKQQVQIPGTVDAAVIYLSGVTVSGAPHDAFFMTTTFGKTIAVDADSGSVLWVYTPEDYASWAGSYRITNATPVADPDRKSLYAASPDGRVQKLAVSDGHALWRTAITELPEREKIASSLNLFKGRVVATTGGYIGDAPPYQGHVAILNAATGRLEHVWNSLCSDRAELIDPKSCPESDSAIWGRSGAIIDPGTGNIFVATGNGRWDGRTFWGDAMIELDPDATRILANYTPSNTEDLNQSDQDLGATSPALVGSGFVAQGGKDGAIRLLALAQIGGSSPHRGGEAQTVPTPSGRDLFTAPAVSKARSGTLLIAADNGGTAAWTFAGGRLQQRWKKGEAGTSPVLAGGRLYGFNPRGGLRVADPETGREIATLDCGGGHWNSPIVADGRIALPEGNSNSHRTSGVLDIWRLPR